MKRPVSGSKRISESLLVPQTQTASLRRSTWSAYGVSLPRGSHVAIPPGKILRMFLHWCQPEKDGEDTDIDLSVGFYDDAWKHTGVCSYYHLQYENIARSGGDRAPPRSSST